MSRELKKFFLKFKLLAQFGILIMVIFGLSLGTLAQTETTDNSSPKVSETEDIILEGQVKNRFEANCKSVDPNAKTTKCQFVTVIVSDGTILPPILIKNEFNDLQVNYNDWQVKDRVIVVGNRKTDGSYDYYIRDADRQIQLWILGILIVVIAFFVARFKGLMALLALSLSTFVIFALFIPQVLAGNNVAFWGIVSTTLILAINQLIGHGVNKLSLIGLFSGFLTLIFAWIISYSAIVLFKLSGGAGEGIIFLRAEKGLSFDFQGLFLAGTMIGVTGAIDDVVGAQISTIEALASNARSLKFSELYSKSMKVGKEHIVSMINTLFLAYAGASLPLLLLFYINNEQTLTQLMSREDLAEEIVRSGVGSIALLLVVPLTSLCATWYYKRPEWFVTRRKK